MDSSVDGQSSNGRDNRQQQQQQQQPQDGSGEGAASAYERMKAQRDRRHRDFPQQREGSSSVRGS